MALDKFVTETLATYLQPRDPHGAGPRGAYRSTSNIVPTE